MFGYNAKARWTGRCCCNAHEQCPFDNIFSASKIVRHAGHAFFAVKKQIGHRFPAAAAHATWRASNAASGNLGRMRSGQRDHRRRGIAQMRPRAHRWRIAGTSSSFCVGVESLDRFRWFVFGKRPDL